MLGDTITVTVDESPVVLVKINQDYYSAEYLYKDSVGEYRLKVRHSKSGAERKDRHNAELTYLKYATVNTAEEALKVYFVMEALPSISTLELALALTSWVSANSGEVLEKLEGWQS